MKGKNSRWLVGMLVGLLAFSSFGFAYADPGAPPIRRGALIAGEVTAIDGDILTVETNHRGAVQAHTHPGTRFRAPGRPDFSLADIKVGDLVAAQGRFADETTLDARRVALIPPDLADRAHGRVTAIDGGAITVEDKDGNVATIVTSIETKFHLHGVRDASLDDIRPGMILGAAGQFDTGGALAAKQVFAARAIPLKPSTRPNAPARP